MSWEPSDIGAYLRSRGDDLCKEATALRLEADVLEYEADELYSQADDADEAEAKRADEDPDYAELYAARLDKRQFKLFAFGGAGASSATRDARDG